MRYRLCLLMMMSVAEVRDFNDIMTADGNYVRIPDFFSYIMSVEPAINTNWKKLKEVANTWIRKYGVLQAVDSIELNRTARMSE